MHSPSPLDSRSSAPASHPLPVGKRNLLIVDDEEGPRRSLRIVFKDEYHVLLAEDGAKAIALAKASRVDAAVLDIRLGDMSGIEVLTRLREIDPAIETVMLTAYETPETTRAALRCGACDYLNKPFDIPAMREAVAKAMKRRAYSDEIQASQRKLEELKCQINNHMEELEHARARVMIYASILHDINNPLTYIVNAANLVAEQISQCGFIPPRDQAEIQDSLALVQRFAANCGEIAQRYMQFLRQGSHACATVGLKPVLHDLPLLLRAHSKGEANPVSIEMPTRDLQVRIHGIDLIQILINLIKNALECVPPPSKVQLQHRLLRDSMDLNAFLDGPNDWFFNRTGFHNTPPLLALAVTDDGPGIPPDQLSRVFDSFFSTKPDNQGAGIGLSIVQRLIREAHGALHLHTQAGHGTTFTVFLPVTPEPEP
jgi:two-component system, sensor histidine kinase and response regulator